MQRVAPTRLSMTNLRLRTWVSGIVFDLSRRRR